MGSRNTPGNGRPEAGYSLGGLLLKRLCAQLRAVAFKKEITMAKFVGNIVITVFLVGATVLVIKSLPDLARYMKLRDM